MGLDDLSLSEATTVLTLVLDHLQIRVVHHGAIVMILSEVVISRLMDDNRLTRDI